MKKSLSVFLISRVLGSRYKCLFGPDTNGNLEENIVETSVATNCGSFCQCEGLKESTCYFGPDTEGFFLKETGLASEVADSCDPDTWCICDTHEYQEGTSFEQELQKRLKYPEVPAQTQEDKPTSNVVSNIESNANDEAGADSNKTDTDDNNV